MSTPEHRLPERDRPWMMRTYAGHSTAAKSNELYRGNLAKGQTGLSIAFDLPTQTGYDPDHVLARGEVGKVGVPVAHKGDMHALLDGIPLDAMNTSMTINATAAWLLALYIVTAEDNGIDEAASSRARPRTTSSRSSWPAGPTPSRPGPRCGSSPTWSPTPSSTCRGGTRSTSAATTCRRPARRRCRRSPTPWPTPSRSSTRSASGWRRSGWARSSAASRSSSTRASASSRSTRSSARCRVLWEELGRERYGVTDERHLRFRYGVQVNSLGLTESQPENNVQRIVLEALAVTLGAARGRGRSSSRPGTRPSACPARGTSSGRCASSRSWPTRPTCSSTPTSSRARRSWTASWPSSWRARAPRWPSWPSTAARSRAWTT